MSMNIFSKITRIQCSWVKRLCDDSFHAWKVIPLFLIKSHPGKNVAFQSHLSIKQNIVKKLRKFSQEILTKWEYAYLLPQMFYQLLPQLIWYNEYIKIYYNTIYNCYFSQKKTYSNQ